MRLVLLGTTGYHPNDRRHTACFMLPESGVVFDAGTAMYRVRDYLCAPTLDIFLTHAHLDHIVGLTFLLDVLYQKPMDRVTVWGEAPKLAAIEEHLLNEHLFPVALPCEYAPLAANVKLPDGGVVSHFPLEHPGGAVGYRVDWPDRSLAYVSDTIARPDADYIKHIHGVDLLVHECYFSDDHRDFANLTGHSHTSAVASAARAADVKRLLLVHTTPASTDDDPINLPLARSIFPATEIAEDRMEVHF